MTKLSANLSLLFTENEFIDRFKEAKNNGFSQADIIKMPANNFSIIYRKVSY